MINKFVYSLLHAPRSSESSLDRSSLLLPKMAAAPRRSLATVLLFTMKTAAVILLSLVSSVASAPAVVWKSNQRNRSGHHCSHDVHASDVLTKTLNEDGLDSEIQAVVFLLRRSKDGSETLTALASEGFLPAIAVKYDDAHVIHHHVSGIEGSNTIARGASAARPGDVVLQVTLSEFSSKLLSLEAPLEIEVSESGMLSKAAKHSNKRTRLLSEANIFIVDISANTDPAAIDRAVVAAIEHPKIGSVILSAVRSTSEVKMDRDVQARRRMQAMQKAGSSMLASNARRLDQAADGNNNQDLSGVYYVQMTPNILAGIMFFFLFTFTTYIGISCMGMIAGQTVYVSKMPSIGREA